MERWNSASNNCYEWRFSVQRLLCFPTILINDFRRITANQIFFTIKSLHCPPLQWSQQLAGVETMCGGRGEIRKTERGKEWVGEWSEGVVRGIIECLRGPRRHWAAGQGEENGVEERKKRLSQWERQREKQQGSRVREVANTFRVNCWLQARPGLQRGLGDDTPFD